jgi:hypothetical protein
MANETLNHVAATVAADRPHCRVVSVGWGPWRGGMVTAPIAARFEERGAALIEPSAGAAALLDELRRDPGDGSRVVLGAGGFGDRRSSGEIRVDARSHPQLTDHEISGVSVLPMAMAVDWLLTLAAANRPTANRPTANRPTANRPAANRPGSPGPVLRDVRVLRGVRLERLTDGHLISLHARPGTTASTLDLELRADDDALRYRAVADFTVPPVGDWPVPGPLVRSDRAPVYDGDVLFNGPMFQAIRTLGAVTDSGAEAEIVGWPELGWTDDPGRHTDAAALDGAVQVGVLWARRVLGGGTLPMGVTEVRVHRPGPVRGPARCLVRAGAVGNGMVGCDVAALHPDGTVLFELIGLTLVRRPDQPAG